MPLLFQTNMCCSGKALAGSAPVRGGTIRQLGSIARVEGVRGVFKGLVPTMGTTVPFSALYLTLYQHTRRELSQRYPGNSTAINFLSGMAAATGACTITQVLARAGASRQCACTRQNARIGLGHAACCCCCCFTSRGACPARNQRRSGSLGS